MIKRPENAIFIEDNNELFQLDKLVFPIPDKVLSSSSSSIDNNVIPKIIYKWRALKIRLDSKGNVYTTTANDKFIIEHGKDQYETSYYIGSLVQDNDVDKFLSMKVDFHKKREIPTKFDDFKTNNNSVNDWTSPTTTTTESITRFPCLQIKMIAKLVPITKEFLLKYFNVKSTIPKDTILYHGTDTKWTELKSKPLFLSFKEEETIPSEFKAKFKLIADLDVIDFGKKMFFESNYNKVPEKQGTLCEYNRRSLKEFVLGTYYIVELPRETKDELIKQYGSYTFQVDYDAFYLKNLNSAELNGWTSIDFHNTQKEFDIEEYNEDGPETKEVLITDPVKNLEFMEIYPTSKTTTTTTTTTTTDKNKNATTTTKKSALRIGVSICQNFELSIGIMEINGKNLYFIQNKDGTPYCRHRYIHKKRLVEYLRSKYPESLVCPNCEGIKI